MKTRRTRAQWLSLINEFEQSGLTQTEFCNQRGINPKYFSLRRMKLKAQPESSGFIQAVTGDPPSGQSRDNTLRCGDREDVGWQCTRHCTAG